MDPENYLVFAQTVASFWARKFPYAAEDILSVAYVALITACNAWKGGENPEGWIRKIIDNDINKYLMEDKLIAMSRATIVLRLKKNPKNPDIPKIIYGDRESLEKIKAPQINPINEILEGLKLTKLEYKVLKLKMEGYTLKEIASILGKKKHTNIVFIENKIRRKYLRWLSDNS